MTKNIIALSLALACCGCQNKSNTDTEYSSQANSPPPATEVTSAYQEQTQFEQDSASDAATQLYSYSAVEDSDEEQQDPDWNTYSEELDRERIAQAKRDVVDAQYDLNRSVRALSYGDWDNDLPTAQRRLRALEDANSNLSALDSSAASDMDWEIQRMKRDMRRLEDENWRDVVPDIERRNRSLNWESDDLESSIDE